MTSDPDRMFDHRLGLALGKTLSEIRSMPHDEFESWKTFYRLEPFGFHDREYRTSALLKQMWNTHVTKKAHAKTEKDYYRDMEGLIFEADRKQREYESMRERFMKATPKEKGRMIAQSFRGVAKDVKIGNSGNDSG